MCEKRYSLPFKPSALRAEVTALAQQKRQGFLLLFLLKGYHLPPNGYLGVVGLQPVFLFTS